MKKRKLKTIGTILIIIILIVTIVAAGYEYLTVRDLNETNRSLQSQIRANTQTVYVSTTAIAKNSPICSTGNSKNMELQTISTGLDSTNYITQEDMETLDGSIALIDIHPGVPVMYNMVTTKNITNDVRAYEIAASNLMTDQQEYDYVDIRISFPDGSDYCVLAKKQVSNLHLAECVFNTEMNEDEIDRMNSAMIDAYTIKGCRMYTVRYLESNLQEATKANYPVKAATIDLINNDPNILDKAVETLNLTARLSLEERCGKLKDETKTNVDTGYEDESSKKTTIITNQENKDIADNATTTDGE